MIQFEIKIPSPSWESNLANIILDLEKLRGKELYWEIPAHIFFQLKDIFQMLETLGSARIEWNNTTLSEYIEKIIEEEKNKKTKELNIDKKQENQIEIENIEEAIMFIENNTDCNTVINRAYVSELHKIVTKNLTPPPKGEGSKYPWSLRKHNVSIKKSNHKPPEHVILEDNFQEFINFININYIEQNQLLMVAIAHHRFAYIHPFDNWNWRMWRLLNYAFLMKLGFLKKDARIINPSSVFYSDRDKYYDMLSQADCLKDSNILVWAEYFLSWLKNEIEKIDSLCDRNYVKDKVLFPAIEYALDRESITKQEAKILKLLVSKKKMLIKAEELSEIWIMDSVQKSRIMSKLREKNIIHPISKGGRIYTISFVDNYLLRWVINTLKREWFVSEFLNDSRN